MKKILQILILIIVILSCSSKKKIIYIQDTDRLDNNKSTYFEYVLKSGDILYINVSPKSILNSNLLNESQAFNNTLTRESLIFKGNTIDKDGYISYPSVGKIKAENLTVNELEDKIYDKILQNEILTDHTVNIKVLNWDVNILGEVNSPGRYYFDNQNLNLFEAIAMAGDLTINGKRKDVNIVREVNGEFEVLKVDLTSVSIFDQKNFLIFPGDTIIVNPNSSRVKNAGIIGNSGTLLSLLSFILSSIIVISN